METIVPGHENGSVERDTLPTSELETDLIGALPPIFLPSHENVVVEELVFYMPEGVTEFVGLGSSSYIGAIDDKTVLKYPKRVGNANELAMLMAEVQMLEAVGRHEHIIAFHGRREDSSILLERATNGSVSQYLRDHEPPSLAQKLTWMRQTASALSATHKANVIHCDVNVSNLLLDDALNIKLCDFQGGLLRPDGSTEALGWARENTKSCMPTRPYPDYADCKTDMFALASAYYYIMVGHEPFPDLDPFLMEEEEEIIARFKSLQFPHVEPLWVCIVIHKCWLGAYNDAAAVVRALEDGRAAADGSVEDVNVPQ